MDLNNVNTLLGVHTKPTMRQGIYMTSSHGPRLVCSLFLPVDVEMTLEVPTPPLVVANDDIVEMLG
jgi:hypothetical protein